MKKILSEFSNRQLELTNEWENWNQKNDIETLLKEIIMANEEVSYATLIYSLKTPGRLTNMFLLATDIEEFSSQKFSSGFFSGYPLIFLLEIF